MKKLSLFLALCAGIACEKEIDFTIPDPGSKITIDTRLVAGEPVSAWLSQSTYSLSSDNPKPARGFEAYLYNQREELVDSLYSLEFSPGGNIFYRGNFLIEPDNSYRLEVNYPNLKTAWAYVNVPVNKEVTCLNWNNNLREIDFCIDQNFKGWYRISMVNSLVIGEMPISFSTISPGLEVFDADFGDFEDDDFNRTFGNYAYLSPLALGTNKRFSLRVEDPDLNLSQGFYLKVERINEAYYRHEKTKIAQGLTDGFFSEPVQVFSNVENGYGIVGTSTPYFNFIDTQ